MLEKRLIAAREKAGKSQEQVAEAVGVTQAAYSYYEHGYKVPSLPVAKRIAATLGVSLDYLVGNDGNDEN